MKTLVRTLISWGPAGVFLLAVLDSAGVPIPGGVDALLITVSALEPKSAYWSASLAIGGSLIGSLILYYIGRRGGERYLEKYTAKGRGAIFKRWFLRYGLVTIFVPALVPIPMPMKVFVLSAGALGIKLLSFTLVVLAARIPRYLALAYLGAKVGENSLSYLKDNAWELIGIAVGLTALLVLLIRVNEKFRQRRKASFSK